MSYFRDWNHLLTHFGLEIIRLLCYPYFPYSFGHWFYLIWASFVAQLVKNLPAVQGTWVQSLGWEDLLEKGMAGYPLQYSGLENFTDGSPWDHKESDMTEWFSLSIWFYHLNNLLSTPCLCSVPLFLRLSHLDYFSSFLTGLFPSLTLEEYLFSMWN